MARISVGLFVCLVVYHLQHQVVSAIESSLLHNETRTVNTNRVKRQYDESPHHFTLMVGNEGKLILIRFKIIERSLANKYLPVWSAAKNRRQQHLIDYILHKKVMDQVGAFSLYENKFQNAAVIFFTKHGLLNGYIGKKYVIKNLPWNLREDIHEVGGLYIVEREISDADDSDKSPLNTNLDEHHKEYLSNDILKQTGNLNDEIPKIYPELLVVIDYYLYQHYSQFPISGLSGYALVVYHVLTKFHAADMLFKDLSKSDIQLNIAAILIEEEPGIIINANSDSESKDSRVDLSDGSILLHIQSHFYTYNDIFSIDSYDILLVMSSHELYSMGQYKDGIGFSTSLNTIQFRKMLCPAIPLAIFIHVGNHNVVEVIMNTIGQLMIIDRSLIIKESSMNNIDNVNPCTLNIVPEAHLMYRECFHGIWNEYFISRIKIFTESTNVCNFKNIPRSLYPRGPRVLSSKKEQCECYGFHQSDNNYVTCQNHIKCTDSYSCEHDLPLPFDGTLCEKNKICWNEKCVTASNIHSDTH